jgi:INO80 complex subunit C
VRKSAKQILVLERERVGGGDGFLSADLTAARARGEVIEPGGKKRKTLVDGVPGQNRRGFNLKGRGSRVASASGVSTPMTGGESGRTSPGGDEEEEEEIEETTTQLVNPPPGKEVFTCE